MQDSLPPHPLELRYEDFPRVIPVFPLRRVILLPDIPIALNIFETRYLHMILDALTLGRVIGMVQPLRLEEENEDMPPALAPVGCLGRITTFAESGDGKLMISLVGVCRFAVEKEMPMEKGYRRVVADYARFEADTRTAPELPLHLGQLKSEFAPYLKKKDCAIDWDAITEVPGALTVDYLSSHLPFSPEEKQALLETATHKDRLALMRGFARMEASADILPEETSSARH